MERFISEFYSRVFINKIVLPVDCCFSIFLRRDKIPHLRCLLRVTRKTGMGDAWLLNVASDDRPPWKAWLCQCPSVLLHFCLNYERMFLSAASLSLSSDACEAAQGWREGLLATRSTWWILYYSCKRRRVRFYVINMYE